MFFKLPFDFLVILFLDDLKWLFILLGILLWVGILIVLVLVLYFFIRWFRSEKRANRLALRKQQNLLADSSKSSEEV